MLNLLPTKQVVGLLKQALWFGSSYFLAPRTWRRSLVRSAVMALAAGFLTPLGAEPLQTSDSLRQAVRSHLETHAPMVKGSVRIEVGTIDSRLRLPACGSALQTAVPNGVQAIGHVTVGVRCANPAWSIYIPARVQVYDKIAIVNRSLPRGALLTGEVVELMEQDVTRLAGGYFTDPQAIVGKMLRRPVTPGTAIAPSLVQEPLLIRRGDRVVLLARTGGVEVRMEGEALEDGVRGEQVRARNLRSKREVEATVVAPGTVEVRI